MFKNSCTISFFSTLLISVTSAAALAGDLIPASIDTKVPCANPAYPRASLVNEEQGTVNLEFVIGVDGQVVEARVEKSSSFKKLDTAALEALSKCKFKPATKDGKPEQSATRLKYVWKLE